MSFLAGKGLPSEGKELGNVHPGDEENRPLTLFRVPSPLPMADGDTCSRSPHEQCWDGACWREAQLWTSTAGCLLAVPGSSPPQPSAPA